MNGKIIYLLVTAILGIVASYTSFQWMVMLGIIFILLAIRWRLKRHIFVGCVITFFLFAAYFYFTNSFNKPNIISTANQVTGKISSLPKIDGDKFTATFQTREKEKLLIKYKIPSLSEKNMLATFTIGMKCQFNGHLEKPSPARNPNAFDYQQYLYFQKIHYIFIPQKIAMLNCQKSPYTLIEYLALLRQKEILFIEHTYPPETAPFMEALLFGKRDNLSTQIINSFQSLGTIHILAISGLHLSLLAGLIFYVGIKFGITREKMHLFLFIFIPAYIVLAGAAPSVTRSGIMTMIGLLTLKYPHYLSSTDAIGLSGLVMLIYNPYYLFQIGFQLSFVVCCALLLSAKLILHSASGFLRQLCYVTVIAQLIVFPLILFYFYSISLLSLIANMIFVPLFSFVILPLAILSYLFSLIVPIFGQLFIPFLSSILKMSSTLSTFLSSLHGFTLNLGKPPVLLLLAYYVCIVAIIVFWEKRKNVLFSVFCLILILILHWNWHSFISTGVITMIDVGQGESFLIELPYRKAVYLIDTGGTTHFEKEKWKIKANQFSIGEDVLLPFLQAKGIRKIDKLILTHGDLDHIGAVFPLISKIDIDQVYFPKGPTFDQVEKNLFNHLDHANIPIHFVKRGEKWAKGGYAFHILSPIGTEAKQNNRSIVILTRIGGLNWLFTGDLEKEGESSLVSKYPHLKVDVLKVGHHGSSTSSSDIFLDKLAPTFGLISVGKNNRFHHPHPDTIKKLRNRGVFIMRTDKNGAVQFKFTKNSGTFFTQLPYDTWNNQDMPAH